MSSQFVYYFAMRNLLPIFLAVVFALPAQSDVIDKSVAAFKHQAEAHPRIWWSTKAVVKTGVQVAIILFSIKH